MRYLGNKTRLSKDLSPILTQHLNGSNWYIEPFVGAAGMIQSIDYHKRFGADYNEFIIALLDSLKTVKIDSSICLFDELIINEDLYNKVKSNIGEYPPHLVGLLAFGCSFGGKFFGGYARGGLTSKGQERNHASETLRNLQKLAPKIKDVIFVNKSYLSLHIPNGSVIYADPPYAGTTKYRDEFNHDEFWQWCRDLSENNYLYVSEYQAPDDFIPVWSKEHKTGIHHSFKEHSQRIEKLFIYKRGILNNERRAI